jgi:hypothetical protein
LKRYSVLLALLCAASLAGCGGGGGQSTVPGVTQANLGSNKLQLAVGTANVPADGVVGLNVVATYRQPSGISAVLADTPTLTGPTGFTVPAGTPGAYGGASSDAGTNHISGSPQVARNQTAVNSVLGTFTGVFSYGLGPFNSDQTGTAYYPGNPNATPGNGYVLSIYAGSAITGTNGTTPQPYASANAFDYLGGPPAYPFFNDGTFPPGFAGYPQGISVFEYAPVAGTYNLSVAVTPSNAPAITPTATATLSNLTPLPALPAPTFTKDGTGGGTASVVVPADSRIVETMIYIVDGTSGTFYTLGPLRGTGTLSAALPDKLGKCNGTNCQNGAGAAPSLSTGDTYFVSAVTYDYPAFEASPPGSTTQTPTITGANGQADVSLSPARSGTY